MILNVISRYHELLNGILNVIDLERRKVIQKHSYVSSTDSIRSPHEIDNEEDQKEPFEDVEHIILNHSLTHNMLKSKLIRK